MPSDGWGNSHGLTQRGLYPQPNLPLPLPSSSREEEEEEWEEKEEALPVESFAPDKEIDR